MKLLIIAFFIAVASMSSLASANSGKFELTVTKITKSGSEKIVECYTEYNLSSSQEIRGEGTLNLELEDISTKLKFHQVESGSVYFTHYLNKEQVSQTILTDDSSVSVGPFGNSYHVTISKPGKISKETAICR